MPSPNPSIARGSNRIALLLAFFVIYVVWGSTYLAMQARMVQTIPPRLVVGIRQGVAGLAIFAWVYARGYRPTLREWRASVVLGILYFVISHGLLHWAETIVPSGIAALLIATEPLWIAIMAAAISRERFTAKTGLGLALGLAGVALLMREEAGLDHGRMLLGCAAVLISSFTWACGVMYARNPKLPKDPIARAGMAALTGSVLLLLASAASGEITRSHIAAFSARSIWALLYLVVFGTIIAFTTYTWLLDHCSPTLVSTHTYANPIIAVLLGWWLAGETLDMRVLFAGLLTLLAVFLISRGTAERPPVAAPLDEAA